MSGKNILFTGVTGNLGSRLVKFHLLNNKQNNNYFLIIRARNQNDAQNRIIRLFKEQFGEKYKNFLKTNFKILVGNISEKKLGLKDKEYDRLRHQTDTIFHSAALTNFQDSLPIQRISNVIGTKRILDLVMTKNNIDFHYISTIFVTGTYKGKFDEKNFDLRQGFNNSYEQSKFEAERIIRVSFLKGDPRRTVSIYRPGIIVGDFQSGAIINFQMFYHVLYLITKGVINKIPVNRNTFLPIIPADIAAKMILLLSKNNITKGDINTYHIISHNMLKIAYVNSIISQYFGIKEIKFSPFQKNENQNPAFNKFLQFMITYLCFNPKIESRITWDILNLYNFKFPLLDDRYIKRVLDYAVKARYLRN